MPRLTLHAAVKVAKDQTFPAGTVIDAPADDPDIEAMVARGFASWVKPEAGTEKGEDPPDTSRPAKRPGKPS